MAVSVRFEAETGDYESGVDTLIKAIRDWETQTGVSVKNADRKFEEAIRAVVELGRRTEQSTDDVVRALEGIGLPADDAREAIRRIERETQDLGREAPRDTEKVSDALEEVADSADDAGEAAKRAGDDIGSIGDKAAPVGDGLRDIGQIAKDALAGDFGAAAEGALGSLSALGAAAGVGGAVGGAIADAVGGLVANLVEAWDPFNKRTQEVRDELVGTLIGMGGAFDDSGIQNRLQDTAADTEKWAQANILAKATGMDVSEALRAVAGVAGDESVAAYAALQAAMNDSSSVAQTLGSTGLRALEQTLQGNVQAASEAEERQRALAGAMEITEANTQKANEKIAEAGELLRNGLPQPGPIRIQVDVEDHTQSQVDRIVSRISGRRAVIGVQAYEIGGRQLL